MSKNYTYLRHWITGEDYGPSFQPRPVILECLRSRSGMSMGVYDRGKRIFSVNGCGFDRIGTALGGVLEACFQDELAGFTENEEGLGGAYSLGVFGAPGKPVRLDGAYGFESMRKVAAAIGLEVTQSESKAGTLLIIQKAR